MYTVYIWYFGQGIHQRYGHTRCIYTVLANPTHTACTVLWSGDSLLAAFWCCTNVELASTVHVYVHTA